MTFEQTKEQFLLAYNSNAYLNMCESDDMHNAIVALEKQIPKKPIYKIEELFRLCPNCDFPLPLCFKFCNRCGQALNWSDTE